MIIRSLMFDFLDRGEAYAAGNATLNENSTHHSLQNELQHIHGYFMNLVLMASVIGYK